MQKLRKMTDEELLGAYAGGCNEAFDELLDRHKSQIFSYILSIVKNKEVADDIFQETFVKAIMTIRQGRYYDSGRFPAWLMRIAHNLVIDYFRQEKSGSTTSTDNPEINVLNRIELSEGTVEDDLVARQTRADIRRFISRLPEEQKAVVLMRYYKNLPFKQIAELTGVSINTALGRMRYALLNLRKMASEADGLAVTA